MKNPKKILNQLTVRDRTLLVAALSVPLSVVPLVEVRNLDEDARAKGVVEQQPRTMAKATSATLKICCFLFLILELISCIGKVAQGQNKKVNRRNQKNLCRFARKISTIGTQNATHSEEKKNMLS